MPKPVSAQRSENMRRIHSKDTKIELVLRKVLREHGYGYKIAIFCDSEFFHGKDWEVLKPQLERGNNGPFWVKKIARNMERDDKVNKSLLFRGWTVIRFWGKDIIKKPDECLKVIEETIFDNMMAENNPTVDEKLF